MMSQIECDIIGGDEDAFQRHLARELLRYAVQTAVFSPYGGGRLDVRRAVLIDGTDFTRADGERGRMRVMTADEFDTLTEHLGGTDALKVAFGHDFAVYDGRMMMSDDALGVQSGADGSVQATSPETY
jgi:hypothetical protein